MPDIPKRGALPLIAAQTKAAAQTLGSGFVYFCG
jgi:hypothetical protein